MRIPVLCAMLCSMVGALNAQNGWRMSGYNGSRTNLSPASGPTALPTFQPLFSNASGSLSRIAKDGSLVLYDGNNLSYFSSTGALKWAVVVGAISDIAIGPTGTIYTSTPTAVSAWNSATGQPAWAAPVVVNTGNETSALAIDSAGAIYINTGGNFVGATQEVTALNADGSLKWTMSPGIFERGYSTLVLSADESTIYVLTLTDASDGDISLEVGISTATGQGIYGLGFQVRGNTYSFAPWNVLYTGGISGMVGCSPDLSTCNFFSIQPGGIAALTPQGTIVGIATSSLEGITTTGNQLWLLSEQLTSAISDANGTLFAIAPLTNDVVAFNGNTGVQLWRQSFSATPTAVLIGDDNNLYVSVGTTLYKSGIRTATGTITVTAGVSAATFTITGPATYTGSGASFTQLNAPAGAYTITYGPVTSYLTPPGQTMTLSAGGAITFPESYVSSASLGSGALTQNGSVAEPVNTATGNYYTTHTDLRAPGKGLTFAFVRFYNSSDPYSGPLGTGWTHSYNIFLRQVSGTAVIKEADGHEDIFNPTGGGNYAAQTPGLFDSLYMNANGSFTLTRTSQIKFNFSATGLLTSIVDRNGNTQTLAYSGNNLTSVTDSSGRVFSFTYDGSNHLITLTDPLGSVLHYGYDATDDLTSYIDALGGKTQYAYNGTHWMTSATDPRSDVYLQNTYDPQGRVSLQSNARGFATSFAYNTPSTGVTAITDPLGNTTQYVHDRGLRLTEIVNPLGGQTLYTYSASNLKLLATDPMGRTQTFAYDGKGNLTSAADPYGKTTLFAYDTTNDLLSVTDRLGRTAHFSYDSKGNLLSVVDAAGNTSTFTYSTAGEVTTAKNARGFSTDFSYDAAGNLIHVTDALGGSIQMTYDAVGRLLSITNQLGETFKRAYDADDRVISATDPLGDTTQLSYDPNSNMVQITDANGKITRYAYDPTNKLIQVTDAIGGITGYAYDGNINLISVTDAKGHATTYGYDPLSRLVTITDPLARQRHYNYDGVGNVTSTTDGNSKTNSFAYDLLNRLVSMALSDGKNVAYTYNPVGDRLTMTDWRGLSTYAYDALDRVLSVATPDGNSVGYAYDAVGDRLKLTYADGRAVQYQYDALNRLTKVTDWSNKSTGYAFDPASNLTLMTQPNGASSLYLYDSANRLVSVTNLAGFLPVSESAYTLDKVGNRTAIVSSAGGLGQYGYDGLYRLTSWTDLFGHVTQYGYDAVGNRLAVTSPSGTTSYIYDAADQLLKAGATAFAYDGNGNQITKTTGSSTVNYGWDALNRLISVAGGSVNTQYQYDGDGNRVHQQVGANAYQYVNDPARALPVVLNENGPDGNIEYVFGQSLVSATSPTFQSFYQIDGLGSVVNVTNQTGTLVANYAYDAWGQTPTPVASPFGLDTLGTKNKYKFTGEALDPNDGLLFLRARYYDSSVGRFISRDPLQSQLLSVYRYANDSPLNLTDPTGLSSEPTDLANRQTISTSTPESIACLANCSTPDWLGAGGVLTDTAEYAASKFGLLSKTQLDPLSKLDSAISAIGFVKGTYDVLVNPHLTTLQKTFNIGILGAATKATGFLGIIVGIEQVLWPQEFNETINDYLIGPSVVH